MSSSDDDSNVDCEVRDLPSIEASSSVQVAEELPPVIDEPTEHEAVEEKMESPLAQSTPKPVIDEITEQPLKTEDGDELKPTAAIDCVDESDDETDCSVMESDHLNSD